MRDTLPSRLMIRNEKLNQYKWYKCNKDKDKERKRKRKKKKKRKKTFG